MEIIDSRFFIRGINIAQLSQIEVRENLDNYIKYYQAEFLIKLLGEEMYLDFKTGLEQDPIDQKWQDLKSWLANDEFKISPIANYVYTIVVYDESVENTGIGMVYPEGENSNRATPIYKSVTAWNNMRIMCEDIHVKIRKNISDYPNYKHRRYHSILGGGNFVCGGAELFPVRNTLGI